MKRKPIINNLYAVDLKTGDVRWTYAMGGLNVIPELSFLPERKCMLA